MKRRTVIAGLAAGAAALGIPPARAETPAPGAPACRLITQDITGPYYLDERHDRANITEGLPGIPLTLEFEVVGTLFNCEPLPGALVSLWHCNAAGMYSGVTNLVLDADLNPVADGGADQRDKTYLRGVQSTDANGLVRFHTIFPGWYYPRPTHVHLKVYPPTFGEVATTQLYFAPEVCDAVYRREPYAARGPSPNRFRAGDVSGNSSAGAGDLWLDLRADGDGYRARHQLGVTFYADRWGTLHESYRQG